MAKNSQVELFNEEIGRELANPAVMRALIATTFKGLTSPSVHQACLEARIRGFTFKDMLEKNVYAIPYGSSYSLVTSIDYSRKKGMRAGIVGKNAPVYEMDGQKVVSCSVTVKRRVDSGYVGDYTSLVFFDEYTTGKNLWTTKPKTMIAKVAEMHALRMACPEELSQAYTEEEMESEAAQKFAEPMKPYVVARTLPPEDDEPQGRRTQPIEESAKSKETSVDPKDQRAEIAKLLKEKSNFSVSGTTPEKVAEKIMALLGVSYEEDNYVYILGELKALPDYKNRK